MLRDEDLEEPRGTPGEEGYVTPVMVLDDGSKVQFRFPGVLVTSGKPGFNEHGVPRGTP